MEDIHARSYAEVAEAGTDTLHLEEVNIDVRGLDKYSQMVEKEEKKKGKLIPPTHKDHGSREEEKNHANL